MKLFHQYVKENIVLFSELNKACMMKEASLIKGKQIT